MSFEAVPCMFKSRQEDGNEAQLFGLLIRPSGNGGQQPNGQQPQQLVSASAPVPMAIAGPSSIQIVPNPVDNGGAKRKEHHLVGARAMPVMHQKNGVTTMPPNGSSGMPPILPRVKHKSKAAAQIAPTKAVQPLAKAHFEMAQSPSQVVPQLGGAIVAEGCDPLSVATSSSNPSSSSSSTYLSPPTPSPNGLLAIRPSKAKQQKTTEKKAATATTRRRKGNKTEEKKLAEVTTENDATGTTDLLGDLHSIDYSQLVNSTVITTEDYLSSQSDPIYTNMDMYGGGGQAAQEERRQHQMRSGTRPSQNVEQQQSATTPCISVPASSLCPSAIFLHNQQQHFANPGAVPSSFRHLGGPMGQPSTTWHPYLGAHPGGSHISSTPDSGIQSIDGSPPSVYTPPMVSPYASQVGFGLRRAPTWTNGQVRSCESVGNGLGCSSAAAPAVGHPACSSSSAGNCLYAAESVLLGPALAQPTTSNPPALILEQIADGENNNDTGDQEADFSDMPKLVPVTHLELDEVLECDGELPSQSSASAAPPEEPQRPNSAKEVLFHQGMSLHELAECLSSNISKEQLKQLTSLIQSKASGAEEQHSNGTNAQKQRTEAENAPSTSAAAKGAREQLRPQNKKKKREGDANAQQMGISAKRAREQRPSKELQQLSNGVAKGAKQQRNCKQQPLVETNGTEQNKGDTDKEHRQENGGVEKQRIAQLAAYRSKVREQLRRKLAALMEKMVGRVEGTHLRIAEQQGAVQHCPRRRWPLPWQRLDWEQVHRRTEELRDRGEEKREESRAAEKKRRDEQKTSAEKEGKRSRRAKVEGLREAETGVARPERKRKREQRQRDEEEAKTKAKKAKQGEAPVQKQGTTRMPLLTLRVPRTPAAGRPNSAQRGSGSRSEFPKPAVAHLRVPSSGPRSSSRSPSAGNSSPRRRRRNPLPVPLSSEELAVVRSKQCFLLRNLKHQQRKSTRHKGCFVIREQSTIAVSDSATATVLRRLFAGFGALSPLLPFRRQLNELTRTMNLLLSQPTRSADQLEQFDLLAKQFIASLCLSPSQRDSLRSQYMRLKQAADFSKVELPRETLHSFCGERRRSSAHQPSTSPAKRDSLQRPLTVDTSIDLSYLDSAHPVGRWDPDKAAKLSPSSDNRDHDCVRCICGMAEDDGVMSQCDRCQFWLHADCLDAPVADDQEFVCDFCARHLETTPRVDIVLRPQPSIKLGGCTYFRTLVNSQGLQVRLNEAVYVERLINDKHKSILRELHEECVRKTPQGGSGPSPTQSPLKRRFEAASNGIGRTGRKPTGESTSAEGDGEERRREPNRWWADRQLSAPGPHFHRRDLRIFRVERLFVSPNGQRFIFGCYYARPHETFCDSSRMFCRNELFWTPLFDTLPLDSVIGRCLILEPSIWAMGRPKSPRYLEDDIFVCEYQIDRNQRSFEKIQPKNRYYINTEPYVFNVFPQRLTLKRDFTPFRVASGADAEKLQSLVGQTTRKRVLQEHLEGICAAMKTSKGQD